MKIGLVQMRSVLGSIDKNIEKHLQLIKLTARHEINLLLFPELSLTGYAPRIANALAIKDDNSKLNIFQEVSDTMNMVICIGVPLKNGMKSTISMIIYQPCREKIIYSKRLLHPDEEKYFDPGNSQIILDINGNLIAPAICFESTLDSHFMDCSQNGINFYMASVAKGQRAMHSAHQHYCNLSKRNSIIVGVSNSIGQSEDFMSSGHTAIWDRDGKKITELGEDREGVVEYDSNSGNGKVHLL